MDDLGGSRAAGVNALLQQLCARVVLQLHEVLGASSPDPGPTHIEPSPAGAAELAGQAGDAPLALPPGAAAAVAGSTDERTGGLPPQQPSRLPQPHHHHLYARPPAAASSASR